jgi:hypothetical protein
VNRRRKIVIGVIACAFAVLILTLAAVLIAPKVVDTKTVRDMLRSAIKETSGVEIDFKHLVLDFFPHPHVVFNQVTLSMLPVLRGKAASVSVHPKILPLFLGKMQIDDLRLDSAELNYTLPARSATEKRASQPFSLYDLGKKVQSMVSTLSEFKIPDLDFQVINSRVNLFDSGRKILALRSVNSHLEGPPAGRKITLNCQSNLWQRISMSGLLNTRTFKGSGQVQLTQFLPQDLTAYLFPDSAFQVVDAPADLTIDFKTEGPGQLQIEAHGSTSHLKFRYAQKELNIKNPRIKAALLVDKNSVTLSLTKLALDYPQLNLSANLTLTHDTPPINLQVKGTQVDVASTRQVALTLSGNNDVVKDIFDIVKGGSVPLITLKAQGNSLSDLGNTDNMVIQGQVRDGEIHIPKIQFDLKDASGEVVISRGILQVENLRARLGNSWGQNGKLRLGLIEDVAPFHLETDLRADLSQLPPILKRLVDDKDFQKELALLKELKGSANGKLVLGEDTENVKVKVEASNIHMNAHYGRLPHLLQITGGNFSYDEKRIDVTQLSGKLGKSSFSELTGGLDLEEKQDLEITSGKSRIFLAEIVPWLSSFGALHELGKYHGGGKSIITLSLINYKGPLSSPQHSNYHAAAEVEDIVLKNLPHRPGPVTIASGKFNVDPQTITYTDSQLKTEDAGLKISGAHHRYYEGLEKNGKLTMEGHMGPKTIQWISSFWKLPSKIKFRPVNLSRSHLSWDTEGKTTFSGNLALQNGLKISADILKNTDKLIIEKLFIQDKTSRATMGISLDNKLLTVFFKGNLHKTTLDQLVTENPWLAGWLAGDFKAHIDKKNPLKSTAWGKLKGKEITYPLNPDTPVKINDVAVTATTDKIDLQSADVTFSGSRLNAAGNIGRSAKELLFDMDITADTVDLDQLIQALENSSENNGPKTDPFPPVKGSIRFKSGRFNIGRFTWNPLHADISLNNDTADIRVKKAVICGISTPGTLKVSPPNVEFDLEAFAKDQELNPAKTCLVGETFKADGTYNLKGRFQGRGKAKDLLKTATGQVEFTAKDGHIYHEIILVNVLKFLNTLEVLKGKVNFKDMESKGFGYHSFRVKAKLQEGKLRYEEAVLHGRPMTITAAGEHDLQNGGIDLNLLVGPLVTLDRIFEHIPLIGEIPDSLDVIPLSATGTLDNVHIQPLVPSAVEYELEEMMKKIVERPINLIHGGKTPEH